MEKYHRVRCLPWFLPAVTVFGILAAIVGVAMWASGTAAGLSNTRAMFQTLGVKPIGALSAVDDILRALTVAWTISIALMLVLVVVRCCQKTSGLDSPVLDSLEFIFNFVLWVLVAFVIVVIAGTAVWLAAGFVMDKICTSAYNGGSNVVNAVMDNLRAAAMQALTSLQQLPAEVMQLAPDTITQLEQQLMVFTQDNSTTGFAAGGLSTCPARCFDLSEFSDIFEEGASCYCDMTKLAAAAASAHATWRALITALAGLLLMWLGGSWLNMAFASSFARSVMEGFVYLRSCDRAQQQQQSPLAVHKVTVLPQTAPHTQWYLKTTQMAV